MNRAAAAQGLAFAGDDRDPLGKYPDVDRHSCRLLGPTALVVQGLMGVLVILSLVYKRHRESPKRPWRIWLFDVSKQVVGQMFVHGVNVLVSDLISHHTSANACVSYFLNILIDTTLGVGLIYLSLHLMTYFLTEKIHLKGFESGKYGNPPSFIYWLKQAGIYLLALTFMKFTVLGIFLLFPSIFKLGEWLLSWTWTGEGDALQVIFTMGLFPIIMNVLQFWLIDSIVKASAASERQETEHTDHLDREPLFRASEDEDDEGSVRDDIENQHRARSHSPPRSHSQDKVSTNSMNPYENKPGSGSQTPSQGVEMHAYPPPLTTSTTLNTLSPSSSSSSIASSSSPILKPSKRRRAAPTPLSISSGRQPAMNSPAKGAALPRQQKTRPLRPSTIANPNVQAASDAGPNVWADAWHDNDDWANLVGEDEWTGRRMEQVKDSLSGPRTPGITVG
ncbi:hypothetical protein HGRIS_010201 [Hohenbuehelia grisea]|uniref:Vacuolar membrane protein n=1 Tax=Hohenbuehelia grisea TaxID=104357 RepID=A0ABR3J3I9_9AGAR